MSFFADVLGAFKHHVLEEVGEAGAAGALVERADVVPEIDGNEREAVVFVGDDREAVGQGEFLEGDFGGLEGGGGRERWGLGQPGESNDGKGGNSSEKALGVHRLVSVGRCGVRSVKCAAHGLISGVHEEQRW